MILEDGTEVRRTDPHRHKFDDGMAQYLWVKSLHGMADYDSGDVDAPTGWYARFGRYTLHSNSQGFVWCHRHATPAEAIALLEELDETYADWLDDGFGDEEADE